MCVQLIGMAGSVKPSQAPADVCPVLLIADGHTQEVQRGYSHTEV